MRKSIIAGNWKMNMTQTESVNLVQELLDLGLEGHGDVVLCVPFTSLSMVSEHIFDTNIKLGAQNVFTEDKGAYTGEISADMLADLNVKYVIVGHSERRQIFNESDEFINKKVLKLLGKGLCPILCVGESLEEREAGKEFELVKSQITNCLKNVEKSQLANIVIAYEPIWAIGTGKSASSDDAEEMCKFIRKELNSLFGSVADDVRIQYGGSVKPTSIDELMSKENIDGALVGGASLVAKDFSRIVDYEVIDEY